MAQFAQLGLQDAATPFMEELIVFHDHTLSVAIGISVMVLYLMKLTTSTKLTNKNVLDSQALETVWTLLPAMTLILIAFPSLHILYRFEEILGPFVTIKATGIQWHWSYDYMDHKPLFFKSFMVLTDSLMEGGVRLLDADNRMTVPLFMPIRMLVAAKDVLHAWTVPSLGVKMDAVPGRLNQTAFIAMRPGVFFGQCSEVCGANHSFMPIVVEAVPENHFSKWTEKMKGA
uniref:Cytochrome c oxidase subunit 2 n=2 Tax=Microdevario TaxID=857697 RepID=A0A060PRU8_9TELE|nr:cytochrome c oxidase subunit II [Microdevario nanus]YP_009472236.1 cytochrome c oxidase subunit II [Microdevario kubotai]BAK23072.1 cytochrome c oxidase subunit II [Microdevario nanus]BAO94317.1 cytochrome c oxidase subunit II [Microdevario kubotai]BAV71721.1 cytochrome c oxidase subunit II [Microdevario kubotai]